MGSRLREKQSTIVTTEIQRTQSSTEKSKSELTSDTQDGQDIN